MRKKITVVGAGNVGATLAQRLAELDMADVVLVDMPALEGMPQGKSLDMMESAPIVGYDAKVLGTTSYEATAGSDIVIITAGVPRKPGMSRDDLLNTNAGIMKSVAAEAAKHSPKSILIIVSNPLDAMCLVAMKTSGFPRERVLGMAGVLDSARMRCFIAEALGVSTRCVHAMVLGGHGDTMVPLPRFSTVSGIPVTELMPADKIAAINQRTRDGGAEIVKLLKTGSAYYAPSAASVEMAVSIIRDEKRILPCAAFLKGEYGIDGLFVGVPVKLGAKGLEQVIELKLTPEENAALQKSASAVRELCGALK